MQQHSHLGTASKGSFSSCQGHLGLVGISGWGCMPPVSCLRCCLCTWRCPWTRAFRCKTTQTGGGPKLLDALQDRAYDLAHRHTVGMRRLLSKTQHVVCNRGAVLVPLLVRAGGAPQCEPSCANPPRLVDGPSSECPAWRGNKLWHAGIQHAATI